jgi:hypothetical protein
MECPCPSFIVLLAQVVNRDIRVGLAHYNIRILFPSVATEAAQKAREKQKEGYGIRIRGAVIKPGDRVLVKVVSFDGKHKLADRWEQDPYIVVSQPNTDRFRPNINRYGVCPVDSCLVQLYEWIIGPK